jgi:hypothetical protein
MSRQLFDACKVPPAARAVWYAEGAGHLRAFETAPHEYEERVSDFFARAGLRSGLGGLPLPSGRAIEQGRFQQN